MSHTLRAVSKPEDWAAMHRLRRSTLFAPGRHGEEIAYDENHPDDRSPGNQCFLLWGDDAPIGVVRLDDRGEGVGVVRLVAIAPELQRQGHGRAMSALIDAEASRRGMYRLLINAHNRAVGFYEKTGWTRETWDLRELVGIAAECGQMSKLL
jgi:GNAT superfamily N-acetyltransferase